MDAEIQQGRMIKSIVLCAVLALILSLVGVIAYLNSQGVSPAELARRCAGSKPEWSSYEEDIKGLIGAMPSAQWQGQPVSAERADRGVRIAFQLAEPWARYPFAMPILLRDPLGKHYCSAAAETRGNECVYQFELEEASVAATIPWIEIRFPHGQQRISFDAHGKWTR